jgi:hypothetical protein
MSTPSAARGVWNNSSTAGLLLMLLQIGVGLLLIFKARRIGNAIMKKNEISAP